ncbi:response regulator transcription factor [Erythrobacter sp. JK5]|uniref:response regulator n=1 Tax=Erythrobacter sp. JK5 TaxID=2829500 RepID=UPI001BAC37EA|nr:response regulator transcription factor [Erythrobacter sp. JK5]QUL36763.1 response regulator transcription factor [Erythrobacter sp. JK5]
MTSDKPRTSRIAIVEDDPNLLDHFIDIITAQVDFDLAGAASSVRGARDLIRLEPDLFLLDIGLPDGSGLDLVPEIRQAMDTKVLIVTSFGDRETVVGAISAGADGYLLKDSEPEDIADGIRATLDGGAPISAAAAIYLLERFRGSAPLVDSAVHESDGLSEREVELLNLFARGLTYKEAAAQMGISPLTVGSYVKTVYGKLAVNSRSEAVYEALKTGQLKL